MSFEWVRVRTLQYGVIAIMLLAGLSLGFASRAGANGLLVEDLSGVLQPVDLVDSIINPAGDPLPIISNVGFTGSESSAGTFSGGGGIFGDVDSGIVLGTGKVADVIGPNDANDRTTQLGGAGDADLAALIPGGTTYDATILEFDFNCQNTAPTSIYFYYIFSSDEYNEYVNSRFNDVFGFFLNGVNIALLPDGVTPTAINNVHSGNPFDPTGVKGSFPDFFVNNSRLEGGLFLNDFEMDGFTKRLTAVAQIQPGVNHFKLAITDVSDQKYDSNVFIQGDSFNCGPPPPANIELGPNSATNELGEVHTLTAKVTDPNLFPAPGIQVTFAATSGPNQGTLCVADTDDMGEVQCQYTGNGGPGTDEIHACFFDEEAEQDVCSEPVTKVWINSATDIELTPAYDINELGDNHTLVAKVTGASGLPVSAVRVEFFVLTGPNAGEHCVGNTDSNGKTQCTYTGDGGLGIDEAQACFNNGQQDICSDIVNKEWILTIPDDLILLPASDVNEVGEDHTVTAIASSNSIPVPGVEVQFDVLTGPNSGESCVGNTDSNGETPCTYTGDGGAGTDEIQACTVDQGQGSICSAVATKEWTLELSCDDLLLSNYQSAPSNQQFVDITNVGDSPIGIDGCSLVVYNVFTERSVASVDLTGYLAPGKTLRIGSSSVSDVDLIIPNGTLPTGPGGIAVLDTPAVPNSTRVGSVLPHDVTGMIYISTDMVYAITHLRVPAHNTIYECIYGGSGAGPYNRPFETVGNCI